MDKRKLFLGLAVVFLAYGLLTIALPDAFFGTGTFYENNFAVIRSVSVASLVIGGVWLAATFAVRKS